MHNFNKYCAFLYNLRTKKALILFKILINCAIIFLLFIKRRGLYEVKVYS